MDLQIILSNAVSPPVLFFFLGVLAVFLKSDLDIPQPLPKFFSLYLLIAIGFKGGVELHHSGLNGTVALSLTAAMAMACIVPLYCFFVLRLKLNVHNAGAIAATYGSISAVTFIAATSFLDSLAGKAAPEAVAMYKYSGHMVAAMALMESPAIIIGVLLIRMFARENAEPTANGHKLTSSFGELIRDSLFNQSVLLLVGSMIIGYVSGNKGEIDMGPFINSLFKGMLSLFLLDLGIVAARRLGDLRKAGGFLIGFALVMPILNAMVGITVAKVIGMNPGDALLFAILCGSASYIAVPAAMRLAVPQANPGLYVPMALAITFPFNILVGIPSYMFIISKWW